MSNNNQNEKDIFVDVGGYSLHARIVGKGKPTLVFESGLGDDLEIWNQVQPIMADHMCTLAYDRAGLGKSDASPHPRTISFMVEDLHSLLANANFAPPYLIVAHSLGGLIARMFAYRYPDFVTGLVLVDPAHEDFPKHMAELRSPEQWSTYQRQMDNLSLEAPLGARAEYQHWQQDFESMAPVAWLPHIPTTILTSIRLDRDARRLGTLPEDKELWRQLHESWLKQVPNAKHVVTQKSGHYIHIEQPELVINAVREMIQH